MNSEILDWKSALDETGMSAQAYREKLRDFLPLANDCPDIVFAAIRAGDLARAQEAVHAVRVAAAELGCGMLAQRALALEVALKAGADTQILYGQFSAAVPETLVRASGYLMG